MNLTIDSFWKQRLLVRTRPMAAFVRGWSIEPAHIEGFCEAPLTQGSEWITDSDPLTSPILLVSAAGAVGKSTLARQLSALTGAIYVDLARAAPVGANTISGGLAKSGVHADWQSESTTVLIDGLDEARLRVTQEAFEAFLADIADIAKGRHMPVVLFGRTGAIQDAWLEFERSGAQTAVLEIGYYNEDAAIDFAEARLRQSRPDPKHRDAERAAIKILLERLRKQTARDGDRFAGYAPVLQAVAGRVADTGNPAELTAQIRAGADPITLQNVTNAILTREQAKLSTLDLEDSTLRDRLYRPEEQLERLAALIYQETPPPIPEMSPRDSEAYAKALESWLPEHPFLDGKGGPSSAVVEAQIGAAALVTPQLAEAAARRELDKAAAANPFLAEFYLQRPVSETLLMVPPEHIGIIYNSLRAQLSLGDSASLSIEMNDDAETDDERLKAEAEIILARRGNDQPRILRFSTAQAGTLRLGAHLEDIEITAPFSNIEIGPGSDVILISPVSIQCAKLSITTNRVVAEMPLNQADGGVSLEADEYVGAQISTIPTVREGVLLSVSWPDARTYPWTPYATTRVEDNDPRIKEVVRRFRKFIIAFRSHSKGQLARFKAKLEHERMTKGSGRAVLDLLLEKEIISLSGAMYYLDPVKLGAESGATYAECITHNFKEKTFKFLEPVLAKL